MMNFWTRVIEVFDRSGATRHRPERRRETERYEVATLLRSAIETARPQIEAAHHELLFELPIDAIWIDCDPNRVAHAITTLLNNAARYMPERGLIEIIAEQSRTEIAIRVRDEGLGIPEEMLPEIFTHSRRIAERYHAPRALCIGLSLVKQMLELQGGTVSAHRRGRGTEFVIHLPLSRATQRSAPLNTSGSPLSPDRLSV